MRIGLVRMFMRLVPERIRFAWKLIGRVPQVHGHVRRSIATVRQ
jgi:hypothetical protein